MKKLLALVVGLVMMSSAFADNFAKLRVKIGGATNDNRYFLCVGGTGCVSIAAGNKGQVYPIDSGKIEHVYASDISTLRLSDQELPKSCQIIVKNDQTLTVTGRIVNESKGNNRGVRISDLDCHVA